MKPILKPLLVLILAGLAGGRALAADMTVKVDIPRIDTAEYHRPYVAVWLEDSQKKTVQDIAVWYEQHKAQNEGRKWLKDLRQWWRVSGRSQEEPADGVSGATRPVGTQTLTISDKDKRLSQLPPGDYQLVVEAAREKGGRELVRLPLAWPPTESAQQTANGKRELGKVEISLAP